MVPKPIIVTTPTPPPPPQATSPPLPLQNISSIRTQEKPQTTIATTQPPPTATATATATATVLSTTSTPTQKTKTKPYPSTTRKPPQPTRTRTTTPTSISVPALIFNAFDDIINNFIDPPLKPSVDPKTSLSQNFAPVTELPPTECEIIQGTLPKSLEGAYIRNGPNPQFLPKGPYHLFDGDGMLHAIRIKDGKATLCSRYVKTYKYTIEKEAGYSIIPSVFSGFNNIFGSAARGSLSVARAITGQFNPINGIGVANTSLVLLGNSVFALGESDLPYKVRLTENGDIETVGRFDFDGKLGMSMTAHPKVDSQTGEAFAFRYGPVPPFLTYFWFDKEGKKGPDVGVYSMVRPSFLHDFAVTKKHAVFADIQIGMNPIEMIAGGSPVGSDPSKVSRLGVLPRYALDESQIKWFEASGFNPIHLTNAWEEDDGKTITLIAPNILSVEHTLERMDMVHAMVEKVTINLHTGHVTRKPISSRNLDFAVINPSYVGKKNRFVYAALGDPMPYVTGVVKLDVSGKGECTVGCRMFGEGCYGGEPFFVARDPEDPEAEEDDGYVVSYVHDEGKGESRFIVMDAKSPELEVVAAVRLPRRVPYGFHGLFVRDSDLRRVSLSS